MTTLPLFDGKACDKIHYFFRHANHGGRGSHGLGTDSESATCIRAIREIRGKIPAIRPSLIVAPPTSRTICTRAAEMILPKPAIPLMLPQNFQWNHLGQGP
jgi:hypothetical protein